MNMNQHIKYPIGNLHMCSLTSLHLLLCQSNMYQLGHEYGPSKFQSMKVAKEDIV